jgi:NDP-mannose synthase
MRGNVPTRAVILAGGLGTRLAPYTNVFPKPLMPVGGRPILELVLRRLAKQGLTEVTLAVSYLEELIRTFFGDGSRFGVRIEYLREEEPLGTVGALSLLKDLPDPCLLMNGDVLTTIDIGDMMVLHRQSGAIMTVATQRREVKIDYGVLEIDQSGKIAGYREKPSLFYTVSAGINIMGRRALSHLRAGERCDVPELVGRIVEAGQQVVAYQGDYYWRDIGRPADYDQANQEFATLESQFGL